MITGAWCDFSSEKFLPRQPVRDRAQAAVAAAQVKKNELHELLQRGLDAANHIILEQQRTDTLHFVDGVASLVQIGIRDDPNSTISLLQSLSPSDTKAALLLEAAWALSKRQSIPVC